MDKIHVGSPVFTREGLDVGEVERVILDPADGKAVEIIVRARDPLELDVVLPLDTCRTWDEHGVRLDLSFQDLATLPAYQEASYVVPPAEEIAGSAYRPSEVLLPLMPVAQPARLNSDLTPGKVVECRDGFCGTVGVVLLEPVSKRPLSFRLRHGGPLTRDVIVPVEWVIDARGDRVRIDCNTTQLEEELPALSVEHPMSA